LLLRVIPLAARLRNRFLCRSSIDQIGEGRSASSAKRQPSPPHLPLSFRSFILTSYFVDLQVFIPIAPLSADHVGVNVSREGVNDEYGVVR
jgi:hypothetical protein